MRSTGNALISALAIVALGAPGAGCDDDQPPSPTDSGPPEVDGGSEDLATLGPPDAVGVADGAEDRFRPEVGERYLLSQTGLYADAARRTLAAGVRPFEPTFVLWSDGADKRRWISLPTGTRIDSSDPDHWSFPVGTRVWKEFSRDGIRLETRLVERTGPGPNDFWMGAFVWYADGSDAEYQVDGATNINGTDHDAPSTKQCSACHGGEPGRLLGVSALQLGAGRPEPLVGLRLADLVAEGLLSHPPAATTVPVPGDADAQAALGYLHANCGHCHSSKGLAYRDVDLVLRLSTSDDQIEKTGVYRTARNVMMAKPVGAPGLRIAPGRPEDSGVIRRMESSDQKLRMPPLATKHPHAAGLAAVTRWITALP